ncbi:MAG TPA: gliding motility-associated C-terminal domain-containing protein, partial [Bacteroidetes bacterium]|nr:gliding motility-associated C-terminal domain-containing protein [Bacteroidota bacterium]
ALPPANPAMLNDAQSPNPALALNTDDYFGEILTFILETRRTGCMVPVFDTVQLVMPRHANGFFPNDTLQLQAANCASSADLCLDIASRDTALFLLTIDNDTIPLAALDTCPGNQLTVSLMPGSHRVELLEYATGCLSATVVEVRCTQTETVEINILKGTTDTLCLSAEELSGPIVSLFNDCPDGSFVHNEIVGDTCIVLTGYLVGEETACMVACDTNGFCDTTFVELSVGHPLPNGLTDTLLVSFNGSYCFDYNQINIVGPIDTFENICPDASGGVVQFNTDPISHCIFYDALSTGQDTACIRLCDALGHCDTVFFNAVVVPGNVVTDTVFISVDTHTYCIDPDLLPGDIVKVSDICPENNGQQVVFEIDGTCVHYYGIAVGPDTACLRIEDALGNVALVQLEVQVVTVTPRVFYDTVFIGQMATYCLDTLELPGRYETFSILFDTDNPERVSFDHNPVSLCVRYEGLVIGRDSFSIALCDHYGFCDTTSLCIIVAPYFDPPGLTADTASTFKETPVVLDPLANDTIYGGLEDFFILEPPISGSASVNLDGSVTYLPDPPFCARWDQFAYVACNPNGCDTTSVSIFIECVELTIFNAVSPNNDGVNDYFYIAKIENFPNNRLWVYNRWGNQVFDSGTEGYKNNWPGTWGDDIDLPDGTYYYILEWSDNGITTVQRGYFEMYR